MFIILTNKAHRMTKFKIKLPMKSGGKTLNQCSLALMVTIWIHMTPTSLSTLQKTTELTKTLFTNVLVRFLLNLKASINYLVLLTIWLLVINWMTFLELLQDSQLRIHLHLFLPKMLFSQLQPNQSQPLSPMLLTLQLVHNQVQMCLCLKVVDQLSWSCWFEYEKTYQ